MKTHNIFTALVFAQLPWQGAFCIANSASHQAGFTSADLKRVGDVVVVRLSFHRKTVGLAVGLMTAGIVLPGCASNVNIDQDAKEAAQTEFPDLGLPSLSSSARAVRGTPTQIYTRIARGAVTCWFGAHGPLKKTHVYHAIAKPPSQGGKARILIHKRDEKMKDKRGARAFAIDIVPTGETAKLEIQNALMGEPRGGDMAKDARRWASGDAGCADEPVAAGWDPRDAAKIRAKANKKITRTSGR